MPRYISHSQVSRMLDCSVSYDLAYVGQLTGGTVLRAKTPHVNLSRGRVFHEGLLAYHRGEGLDAALAAMRAAVEADLAEIDAAGGIAELDRQREIEGLLERILVAYARDNEPLPLANTEVALNVGITRGYAFEGSIDGVVHAFSTPTIEPWLYELKLRRQFTDYAVIAKDRQPWWYAWAYRKQTGITPAGFIYEEVLAEAPGEVRLNQDGKPSKVQTCHAEDYVRACLAAKVQPDADVVLRLRERKQARRHEIVFTDRGLELAGRQIKAAAQQVSLFDRGVVAPIHNPSVMRCKGCAFKDVCLDPLDAPLVDALFNREPPARDRREPRNRTKERV